MKKENERGSERKIDLATLCERKEREAKTKRDKMVYEQDNRTPAECTNMKVVQFRQISHKGYTDKRLSEAVAGGQGSSSGER